MAAFRTSPKSFAEAAVAAFPAQMRDVATQTALGLADCVDDTYRKRSYQVRLLGQDVFVPSRLHFVRESSSNTPGQSYIVAECLMSRATDGRLRQSALRAILQANEVWAIPFIALLIGDYVVEIVNDIARNLSKLDRGAWADFVRENRPAMRLIRSRTASYWDRHYRTAYPHRQDYPGLVLLKHLESWAS